MSESFRRSLIVERDITRTAAQRFNADPDPLIGHAELRADRLSSDYVTDPMMVAINRDMARDVREELADARNYMVWWLSQNTHVIEDDMELFFRRQDALGHLAAAYAAWRD